MSGPGHRMRGITLVELLVVIAIVMILWAITMPLYPGITAHGRRTPCMNNLRQIGQALAMY
ncbi:MAG: prepilin-type cleavage/methylation domain-containing protein, partial [Anaerolineae bacterium]|nr:prepilin-type cleavage/methylation domain-containing protein [Anaerolineae bacterium]NIN95867.1 prepilin-type cleavage/methylation domain-containing protein [Anaerolineae bacterium]NIQ78834.1 prepilin-type cleavage/methylation domain-containing protein [Anaerolineae bacterium]